MIVGEDERDSVGVAFILRTGTCFEMPEPSASRIVDKSSESGGPGEGVRNILVPKVMVVSARISLRKKIGTHQIDQEDLPRESHHSPVGRGDGCPTLTRKRTSEHLVLHRSIVFL